MTSIIDEHDIPSPTLCLIPEDYPKLFRDPNKLYAHPDDYKVDSTAISPQLFVYKDGIRSRLFLRISIKLSETGSQFTTATFLLDTGACAHMFLSDTLFNLIKARIHMEDAGPDYITTTVGGQNINCQIKKDLPKIHQPANVMGLPMLFLMGLTLRQERLSRFTFNEDGTAHDVADQKLQCI